MEQINFLPGTSRVDSDGALVESKTGFSKPSNAQLVGQASRLIADHVDFLNSFGLLRYKHLRWPMQFASPAAVADNEEFDDMRRIQGSHSQVLADGSCQ
jgi:hypothetical protein